jgi:hypothetical protein
MLSEDERPLLVCRLECPQSLQEELDGWMPKHFDDSLADPAVTSASSYAVVRDWERLPSLFNQHGNRFIIYVAESPQGVQDWLDGPQIQGAIEDGVDRESQYPALEGEPFNGTIYAVMEVRRPVGSDVAGRGPIVAERFEVPPALQGEFDAWLDGPHLDAVEAWPGIVRVRTWRQLRDEMPRRFPYERYVGKGNRMILADFEEGVDVRDLLQEPAVRAALEDSQRWDLRLPYVTREACEHLLTRLPGDAEREAAAAATGG